MANFNLEDYEPVEERIRKFYADHSDGRILTKIHQDDGARIIVKAYLYKDNGDVVWSTGYAEEVRGEGYVNKTSALENCETSAIGRALANANYAGSKRPSREEMAKVARNEQPALPEPATPLITPAQRSKIFAVLREMGLTTVDVQRTKLKEVIGKDSTSALTKDEASAAIKQLETEKEGI